MSEFINDKELKQDIVSSKDKVEDYFVPNYIECLNFVAELEHLINTKLNKNEEK